MKSNNNSLLPLLCSILFMLITTNLITLKVYDVLGNEIATLVNEEKLAGSYEVEFDAMRLTSGIYFHQLRAKRGQRHIKVEPLRFYLNLLRYPFLHSQPGKSILVAMLLLLSQAVNAAGFFWSALSKPARRSVETG